VPLDRHQLGRPLHDQRLDDAVAGPGGDAHALAGPVDGLVVVGVDRQLRPEPAAEVVERPSGPDDDIVAALPVAPGLGMVGQMLDQRPAEGHVHHLQPPADGQHGDGPPDGRSHQGDVERIPRRVELAAGAGVDVRLPVGRGVDVVAAGQQQPVEPVEQAVDLVGAADWQQHRQPATGPHGTDVVGVDDLVVLGPPVAGHRCDLGADADERGHRANRRRRPPGKPARPAASGAGLLNRFGRAGPGRS
jgi:hypothetical protein